MIMDGRQIRAPCMTTTKERSEYLYWAPPSSMRDLLRTVGPETPKHALPSSARPLVPKTGKSGDRDADDSHPVSISFVGGFGRTLMLSLLLKCRFAKRALHAVSFPS